MIIFFIIMVEMAICWDFTIVANTTDDVQQSTQYNFSITLISSSFFITPTPFFLSFLWKQRHSDLYSDTHEHTHWGDLAIANQVDATWSSVVKSIRPPSLWDYRAQQRGGRGGREGRKLIRITCVFKQLHQHPQRTMLPGKQLAHSHSPAEDYFLFPVIFDKIIVYGILNRTLAISGVYVFTAVMINYAPPKLTTSGKEWADGIAVNNEYLLYIKRGKKKSRWMLNIVDDFTLCPGCELQETVFLTVFCKTTGFMSSSKKLDDMFRHENIIRAQNLDVFSSLFFV